MLPDLEYGYSESEQTVWCLHRAGGGRRMLCGREVGFIPVLQPTRPVQVCEGCQDVLYGRRTASDAPRVRLGRCPLCEGLVPVEQGRTGAHGVWRVGEGGPYESGEVCLGVNMAPRRGKR